MLSTKYQTMRLAAWVALLECLLLAKPTTVESLHDMRGVKAHIKEGVVYHGHLYLLW